MTIHTGLGRWHPGRIGSLNRRMAITAIYAVVSAMMFVTELDRLLTFYELACVIRRTIDLGQYPHRREHYKNGSEDAQLSERISTVMKNLGHLPCLLCDQVRLKKMLAAITDVDKRTTNQQTRTGIRLRNLDSGSSRLPFFPAIFKYSGQKIFTIDTTFFVSVQVFTRSGRVLM